MPIQGLVRLRTNQIGKQSALLTTVAATRRVPWRDVVDYDPTRTEPDVDVGSIDPVIVPYSGFPAIGWTPTGLLFYNDLPSRLSAGLMGGISATGGGTAKTWTYQIASLTADPFDYFTVESGDDTSASDGIQAYGGVANILEETMDEGLGPWSFSDTWVFAGANLATNRTGGLLVDQSPTIVMGDETDITMDATAGSIGITPLTDALHAATIRVSNNLDLKRFANGSNGRRKLSGYGRGARAIDLELTFAKTTETMAERATLDDEPVPSRFFRVRTLSTVLAQAATPYSYIRDGAFRLFTATDGESGGNTTIILTYRAYYDSTLSYAYKASVINTRSTL
jgi:hypothetical protein